MAALIFCQIVLGTIALAGASSDANRYAAAVSVLLSLLLTTAVLLTQVRREWMILALAAGLAADAAAALRLADAGALRAGWESLGAPLMGPGGFLHPHVLGLASGPASLVGLTAAASPGRRRSFRIVGAVIAAVASTVVVIADSRTAYVGFLAGTISIATTSTTVSRWRSVVAGAILSLAAVGAVALTSLTDANLLVRIRLWRVLLNAMESHWMFGLGFGELPNVYRDAGVVQFGNNAHDLIIQTIADFGLVGLISVVLAGAVSLKAAVAAETSSFGFRCWMACVSYLLVVGLTESIIDVTQTFSTAYVTALSPVVFVVLSVPIRLSGRGQREEIRPR